jgi:hypothetical protein
MTRQATKTVLANMTAETVLFTTAGNQLALDTLQVEMGALKAILPGLTARQTHTPAARTDPQTAEAETEAMFDNMPV